MPLHTKIMQDVLGQAMRKQAMPVHVSRSRPCHCRPHDFGHADASASHVFGGHEVGRTSASGGEEATASTDCTSQSIGQSGNMGHRAARMHRLASICRSAIIRYGWESTDEKAQMGNMDCPSGYRLYPPASNQLSSCEPLAVCEERS